MLKGKIISCILIIALILGISGCNLVEVDSKKDMARIVYETKDGKVEKREFNKLFTYYEVVYQLNGFELPEGEELSALKEELLNSLAEIKILREEAIAKELTIDEENLKTEFEGTVEALKDGFESEDEYVSFIEERNLTQEEFEDYLKEYMEDIHYSNKFIEDYNNNQAESGDEANQEVVTVNGDSLLKDEFYYYLGQMELSYSMMGSGLPQDEESINAIYGQIQDEMARSYLIQEDGKEQGITLDEADIEDKTNESIEQFTEMIGEDYMSDYLTSLYLTEDRYEKIVKSEAITQLYLDAIEEDYKDDTTITEKEIKNYYEENKDSFNPSTISAKHILTESKDFAQQLNDEITDEKSFEEAFEKYGEDENVKEASDLGEFGYGRMVQPFEEVAFDLEPGEVSEIVESEFGYHIIYVYDKNIEEIPTLEEKTKEIKKTLMTQKVDTEISQYKSDLLDNADIEKAEIISPLEVIMEELKEKYQLKTYPDVL